VPFTAVFHASESRQRRPPRCARLGYAGARSRVLFLSLARLRDGRKEAARVAQDSDVLGGARGGGGTVRAGGTHSPTELGDTADSSGDIVRRLGSCPGPHGPTTNRRRHPSSVTLEDKSDGHGSRLATPHVATPALRIPFMTQARAAPTRTQSRSGMRARPHSQHRPRAHPSVPSPAYL
jgi:hypothetical protein